jgi:hypothetical protein
MILVVLQFRYKGNNNHTWYTRRPPSTKSIHSPAGISIHEHLHLTGVKYVGRKQALLNRKFPIEVIEEQEIGSAWPWHGKVNQTKQH